MRKIIIDTNLLIDDENILYKLVNKYDRVVVPVTVLKELDKLKFSPETSFSARKAINALKKFKSDYKDKIEFYVDSTLISSNDEKIIEAAKKTSSDIATKDISMSILAEAKGIKTETYEIVLNNIFKPYVYINITKFNNDKDCKFDFQQSYVKEEYNKAILAIEKYGDKIDRNGWIFIFIEGGTNDLIYANNPEKHKLERIDNVPEYRTLNRNTPLKAMDDYQVCAFYALKEAPNVLITGTFGSGKSLIGTAYCTDHKSKAFVTRAPIGLNKRFDIGFMPGQKLEKLIDWVSGIVSALYYLNANTRGQKDSRGSDYDYIKDELFKEKFEIIPINSIQGLSLLKDDVLMVDEVQLLDIDTMSMILSRPTKDGKLILLGDLGQTYSVVKPSESGLLKLLRILPHRSLAYVELKKSHRGEILELANLLQNKTIF